MRHVPRALFAGGLGFAVAVLVACGGGSGLLSADQSSTLSTQLAAVLSAVRSGQCIPAENAITTFNNLVADLPPSVSRTLRSNLYQGGSTVEQLAARDCRNPPSSTTSSTTTSSTTTSTTTTSSTTVPTTTSTTTSTTVPTTTSTPTTTTPPPTSTTPPATTTTPPGTTSTGGTGGAGLGGGGGGGNGNGG